MPATPPPQPWSPPPAGYPPQQYPPQAYPQQSTGWSQPAAGQTAPPSWQPSSAPAAPRAPMDIGSMALRFAWIIEFVGLLLIFFGTLYVIAAVGTPTCAFNSPPNCSTSWAQGAVTALMVGKIMWVLGLTAIIAGLGSKLQWGLPRPSDDAKDAVWRYVGFERFWHAVLIIVLIIVIWMVMTSVNVSPPLPSLGG